MMPTPRRLLARGAISCADVANRRLCSMDSMNGRQRMPEAAPHPTQAGWVET
jgi:hypothetical protein